MLVVTGMADAGRDVRGRSLRDDDAPGFERSFGGPDFDDAGVVGVRAGAEQAARGGRPSTTGAGAAVRIGGLRPRLGGDNRKQLSGGQLKLQPFCSAIEGTDQTCT